MCPSFRQLGRPLLPLLLVLLALAACDSAEERAQAHYKRGMELLAAGDTDRALVEFRNVFVLDGSNIPARLAYAKAVRARGDSREAMGQYLRVAEQDPGNVEAQRAVIEIALETQDVATAEEHATEAIGLAPRDPMIRALKATVDYRRPETRAVAVETAREVVAEAPATLPAQMVLIADRLNAGAPKEALAMADAALALIPDDQNLHLVRLAALEASGDTAGSGEELKRMVALFPDAPGVTQALVQWHMRAGDPAGAEAVLRTAADRATDPQPALTLVQFLLQVQGPDAAAKELDARIAAAADPRPFQRAKAGLDFSQGRKDQAIAALRQLLDGAEPSDATRDLQLALAQMLAETGGTAESAALVATILAGDPNDVGALKLGARIAIDADDPDRAISDMRLALAQAPNDPEIMTITAIAHERAGSRELAGEQLARAVEVSGQAPAESLRYARFLLQDGKIGPAESVVAAALRKAPDDRDLLQQLGRIQLARKDWARVDQVAGLLRQQDDPAARAMAADLETASLDAQGRTADAAAALEGLAGSDGGTDGGDASAMARLVQNYVAAGDPAAARRYLGDVLAKDPASVPARLLLAGLDLEAGDAAAAEAGYRAVVTDAPALPQAHLALYGFLAGQGRAAEAAAALDAGLAAAPDSPALLFAKAGQLEQKGDVDGAIAAYEALYTKDTGSPVLANNLASLLASNRDDAASLDRAFAIARRLRGTDVPYFQDTYGWILHRRGDDAEALTYLAPAAEGAARQRAGPVPPGRDPVRARGARRRPRELRPRRRCRRRRQPPAPARRGKVPHRRDRRRVGPRRRQGLNGGRSVSNRTGPRDMRGGQVPFPCSAKARMRARNAGGAVVPRLAAALGGAGGGDRRRQVGLGVGHEEPGAAAQPAGGVDLVVVGMLAAAAEPRQEHDRLAVFPGGDHRAHAGVGDHELAVRHRPGVVGALEARGPAHVLRPVAAFADLRQELDRRGLRRRPGVHRPDQPVEGEHRADRHEDQMTAPQNSGPPGRPRCSHWVSRMSATGRASRPDSDSRSVLATEFDPERAAAAELGREERQDPRPRPGRHRELGPLGADDAGEPAPGPEHRLRVLPGEVADRIVADRPERRVGTGLDPDEEELEPVEGRQDAPHLHPVPAGGAGHHDLHARTPRDSASRRDPRRPRISLARAPGRENAILREVRKPRAAAAPAPGGRPAPRTRPARRRGSPRPGSPGRAPKAATRSGSRQARVLSASAWSGNSRQSARSRLRRSIPPWRGSRAMRARQASKAGPGAPSSTCANQPSRKISPPEIPASAFAGWAARMMP